MTAATSARRATYPYRWRVRTRLLERFGQRCRVLVRSRRMNSALVEFEDGYQVVTSRNYVRQAPAPAGARCAGCAAGVVQP